ncbi:MAG: hypothetical protein GY756_06265 [bacterium]|nr:hypothetical protein [bacterium]
MKKFLFALLLFPLFLAGCYESSVPIVKLRNDSVQKVDKNYLGNWVSDKIPKLKILQFNAKEYLIIWSDKNNDTSITQGYSVKIKNHNFMMIKNINSTKSSYIFAKYSFAHSDRAKILLVDIVDKKIFKDKKFTTSEALYNFIEKNVANSKLYGNPYIFMKLNRTDYKVKLN